MVAGLVEGAVGIGMGAYMHVGTITQIGEKVQMLQQAARLGGKAAAAGAAAAAAAAEASECRAAPEFQEFDMTLSTDGTAWVDVAAGKKVSVDEAMAVSVEVRNRRPNPP